MNEIRKAGDRGQADHGWLNSAHTFSFADYHDPAHMGFGPLRVINEDRVAPGKGFGAHSHRDMEILTYVLSGALEHKDSIGTGSVIRYGDVQRMSAGRGVTHSEFNHSPAELVHFLQIWLIPNVRGIPPSYEERHFDAGSKNGHLKLIASPDGRDGSVLVHQDASLYATIIDGSDQVTHHVGAGRLAYLHVARGGLAVNGVTLSAGDALRTDQQGAIQLSNGNDAEVLVFDLPHE